MHDKIVEAANIVIDAPVQNRDFQTWIEAEER
jgi:hypothetical protein